MFRWVDPKFEPHEDFIGLHCVDDITVKTMLKDTMLRMNLDISMHGRSKWSAWSGFGRTTF